MSLGLTRRLVLGSGLALAGCRAPSPALAAVQVQPLRGLAPFPLGVEITADLLADPAAVELLTTNFSQITPGLEMKMERILKDDGSFSFDGADAIADFARAKGLRLHGHNLIWYIYSPPAFEKVKSDPAAFALAYRNYIAAVAGRYRGRVSGWDVVNEPVAEDGDGYRDCLWRQAFGMDYVARAFDHAREADPGAVLFLNEYNLESRPRKLASFLALVQDLQAKGAPIGGIGTQLHMDWKQDPAAVEAMMTELGQTGLPIHVSELDVATRSEGGDLTPMSERLARQAELVRRAALAFKRLPDKQRYAFSVWGLRDKDSWMRTAQQHSDGTDAPCLFDDAGRPKAAAAALAGVFVG